MFIAVNKGFALIEPGRKLIEKRLLKTQLYLNQCTHKVGGTGKAGGPLIY